MSSSSPSPSIVKLKRYVESKGLAFLCSPFGLRSARELRALGVAALKIASPELNHLPLLEEAAGYGLPLILSSGVSTLADIERALSITGRSRVVLLHCITAYPAPEDEYNVSLLASLRSVFGVDVGLSDHSLDPVLVPALAVLHGARVVEKHFALSRGGAGLDDPIALEPSSFARMVRRIRETEAADRTDALYRLEKEYGADRVRRAIGTGVKDLAPSERENYRRTNRSIHAVAEIPAGTVVSADAVALLRTEKVLRPGLGPEFLPAVIGRTTSRTDPRRRGRHLGGPGVARGRGSGRRGERFYGSTLNFSFRAMRRIDSSRVATAISDPNPSSRSSTAVAKWTTSSARVPQSSR